jgi:putative ABC transport system ATP-binding protein
MTDSNPTQAQAMPVLRAIGVSKQVPGESAPLMILEPLSLVVKAGEKLAVVGPSGSGKSTLLALLAGLDRPSSGSVHSGELEISALDEDARAAWRAREVAFVFQQFQLLPALTALENVMLPLELKGTARSETKARALAMLAEVGLAHRPHHYPKQLSGGEQQRVAIARACISQPKILFADEPTGSLDHATGRQIAELLFAMNLRLGMTLILVTHDRALAARCDRMLSLHDGGLMATLDERSA